jgi:hypothetical protein
MLRGQLFPTFHVTLANIAEIELDFIICSNILKMNELKNNVYDGTSHKCLTHVIHRHICMVDIGPTFVDK